MLVGKRLTDVYGQDGTSGVEHESLDLTLRNVPTMIGREFDPAVVSRAGWSQNRHVVATIFTLASFKIYVYNSKNHIMAISLLFGSVYSASI